MRRFVLKGPGTMTELPPDADGPEGEVYMKADDVTEDLTFLDALRAAGVDNWAGMELVCEILNGEDDGR